LSRLNRLSSVAFVVGSVAFSESNGPPGIAFIAKNVIAAMISTVSIASRILFTAYFSIEPYPSLFRPYTCVIILVFYPPELTEVKPISRKSHGIRII